jgi:hypothetical protein
MPIIRKMEKVAIRMACPLRLCFFTVSVEAISVEVISLVPSATTPQLITA